ncbi:MAG TPA: aspartyl/asparaginyl beta-hydroxylase domain-containing protein [Burkholderiales bacterium]|nr:aspartyl/asparaginyl beta-hydroxylase domain-containing protein [Burkholderiales bacterium]
MFLSAETYPFVSDLERNWRVVRSEFEALDAGCRVPWPERELYGRGWEVAGLYAFGRKLEALCARCPGTTRLVEAIPGMTTAGFSFLHPGTHILPHRGYTTDVLRCHLGLLVPSGCSMRVGTETRQWVEGRCLVFDDTNEHEVWHRGDQPRVVLLVDFARSGAAERPAVAMPAVVEAALGRAEPGV